MKCTKCGKLLQHVFVGLAFAFCNPIEIKDAEGKVTHWLVCNNPHCVDGQLNCAVPNSENVPF
jgi:hypothetical protein